MAVVLKYYGDQIQKITFECCCETEARLPGYLGSTLRGSLGRFSLEKITSGSQTMFTKDGSVLRTPLRLKQDNGLNLALPFNTLVRAGLRRIAALEEAYGGGEPDLDYRGLVKRAQEVAITESSIHWQALIRWSNRQKKKVSLSGLGGTAVYKGKLNEFMPILRYCEQVNLGKQTVFGLGRINVKAGTGGAIHG